MSLRALSIAAAGGRALQHQIDTIARNLANLNSPGYKRVRANASDGARLLSTDTLFENGKLQATHRELDLAIEGEGFFRVRTPDDRVAFTRSGTLNRDGLGNLVTPEGWLLDPPVQVPPTISKLVIDPSGFVQGFDAESPEALEPIGQIEISRFANPSGLESAGGSLFRETAAAGERVDGRPGDGLGFVRQGHLEQSNVDSVREMADLVQAQRAFELNLRTIQAADEILQSINSLRRKS